MNTISLGNLVLNGQLVLLFIFGIAGWLALRFYLRQRAEDYQKDYGDLAFNAFLIWIVVWKGSLLLFEPVQTLKNPLSLLYFDGGVRGRWLAAVVVVIYILYRVRKAGIPYKLTLQAATIYLLGGWGVYHTALLIFQPEQWLYLSGHAILAGGLLLSSWIATLPVSWISILQRWQWFTIGLTFLLFFQKGTSPAGFSAGTWQWIAFAAALVLTIAVIRLNRAQTNN